MQCLPFRSPKENSGHQIYPAPIIMESRFPNRLINEVLLHQRSFQLHVGHLLLEENYQPIKAGPWEKRWIRAGSVT